MQRASPDRRFKLGLAAQQPLRVGRLLAGLADRGQDHAQLAEVGGERIVVGRPGGALPQRGGAPALGPLQDGAGALRLEREPQAQRRERVAVHRGAGAQLGRAEGETVLLEHPEPGAQRAQRTAAASGGESSQRLGMPGAQPLGDRSAVACPRDRGEVRGGVVIATESQGNVRGEQLRVQRGGRPACGGELIRDAARAGVQRAVARAAGERRAHGHMLRQRRPAGPALAAEGLLGVLGGRERRARLAARELRLGEREPRLGELGAHVARGEELDDTRRAALRLALQARRQERVTAVHLHDRTAPRARLGEHGLGGVEARERARQVAAAHRQPAAVALDDRDVQRLADLPRELLGFAQVRVGRSQCAAVGLQDAAVAEHRDDVGAVARAPDERERPAIALERLICASEAVEDQRVLAGEGRVARSDVAHREAGLAQRRGRVALVDERVGEAHAPLGHALLGAGTPRRSDRGAEVLDRRRDVVEVHRREAECTLRDRRGLVQALGERASQRAVGEFASSGGVLAEQPVRLLAHRGEVCWGVGP